MILVKKFEIFPCFPFWQKNSQQNVFDDTLDILESKKAILNLVRVVTVLKSTTSYTIISWYTPR